MLNQEYIAPTVCHTPRDAFFSEKTSVPIDHSAGRVCAEFVMCYPPGIPILAPGEMVTREIIDYINYVKKKGSFLTGTEDPKVGSINVMK